MKDQPKVLLIKSVGAAEKKFSSNFSKAKTKTCLGLHYNGTNSYLHVNKAKSYKFKGHDDIRWYEFGLGSVSKDFTKMNKVTCI